MFYLRNASQKWTHVAVAAMLFATRPSADADEVPVDSRDVVSREGISADKDLSRLAWRKSYKQACDEARRRRRPILVKITASWCGPCRQMQQLTFTDDRVRRKLKRDFVLLELDADENPDLVSGFHVEAYPTTLVVSPELKVVSRMTGFKSAGDLMSSLELVKFTPDSESDQESDEDSSDIDVEEPASALAALNETKLAFDGFCLVSLLDENRLRKGDATFTVEYRGQTVCFFSDEHRQRFQANPDRFWPVANGQCLVSSKEAHRQEQGDPRVGVIWRGKLWFFSDRETQQRFLAMPYQYGSDL